MRLATVPLPSITVGAVVASPFVRATIRLAGTADADARVSLVAPFRLGTAHVDAGGQQTADLSEPPRLLPEVGGPDPASAGSVEAELDLEVALAFLVSVGGIPIGGPVVGHSVGAVLRVDPGADPWWSADGAFEVLGGWTFADPVTGLPLVEELATLFRDERPIASAEGPLPAVTTSSRWSRVFDISNSDHAGGAVVDGDGLIVVDDDGAPWVAGLDGLGVPRWQSRVPAGEFGLIGAPTAVRRLGDGAILMAGNGASLGVDRYNLAGTALWRRKLSLPESGSALTCTGIVPGALGGALLAGRAAHDASTLAPYLATLCADGTLERAIELDMGAARPPRRSRRWPPPPRARPALLLASSSS